MILLETFHDSEGDPRDDRPAQYRPARFLHEQLAEASPDLLRQMLSTFVKTLMSAEADAVCGAPYGQPSPERTNSRNGYRHRDFDTRAGSIDVAIPKLRQGTYFPDWLLERRKRAEAALTSVVATSYLLGVSTRRMDKLVEALGITGCPGPRSRGWPPTWTAGRGVPDPPAGRRPVHVRRGGRVDDEGPRGRAGRERARPGRHRGQRGRAPGDPRPTSHLSRGRRRVAGVLPGPERPRPVRGRLVTSDAHRGLVAAIGATLPGASWQRCRTHYAANLMGVVPKAPGEGSRRCSTRSTTSPTPRRYTPSSTGSSTPLADKLPNDVVRNRRDHWEP